MEHLRLRRILRRPQNLIEILVVACFLLVLLAVIALGVGTLLGPPVGRQAVGQAPAAAPAPPREDPSAEGVGGSGGKRLGERPPAPARPAAPDRTAGPRDAGPAGNQTALAGKDYRPSSIRLRGSVSVAGISATAKVDVNTYRMSIDAGAGATPGGELAAATGVECTFQVDGQVIRVADGVRVELVPAVPAGGAASAGTSAAPESLEVDIRVTTDGDPSSCLLVPARGLG
jgi:hypothetical protein